MYTAYGYFINNQLIIENFKNKKNKSRNKLVREPVIFTLEALQNDKYVKVTQQTYNVSNSIDMFEYLLNDINKIIEINISFNIKNNLKSRTFFVKTNNGAEVTFDYQYYQNNINNRYRKIIENIDSNENRFNYRIQIPRTTSDNITKCNITIKPNIDSNVIMINGLNTAIKDILVYRRVYNNLI